MGLFSKDPEPEVVAPAVAAPEATNRVRPVRKLILHLNCGSKSVLPDDVADALSFDPKKQDMVICSHCHSGFDVNQFLWGEDGKKVGS